MPRFISMGCVVLVLLGAIAPSLAGQGLPPVKVRAEKAHLPPPSLDELGKLYQALELPLPPKEAFFAMYGCFDHPLVASPSFSYQLRLATGDPKSGYRIWQGFKDAPTQSLEIAFSRPPRPETVLRYMKMDRLPGSSSMREAGPYAELGFAVQCHLLQHHELAKFFYGRVQKDTDVPPNQTLVMLAWNYWAGELANPERDLAEVARRLHNLADHHGFYEILASWTGNTQKHKDLLDRIDLTTKRSLAKPGPVESIIDELIDDLQTHLGQKRNDEIDVDERVPAPGREYRKRDEPSPRPAPESKLRNMGFAAIPLLIEHVDDRRLVRRFHDTFTVFYGQGDVTRIDTLNSSNFTSVGSRVRGILSAFFELDQHKATKESYLNSWKKLKSLTESEFVSKKLNNIEALNRGFTEFLSKKYKDKSLQTYETILRQGITFPHFDVLLESIVDSDLPKAVKIDLLTRGSQSAYANLALTRLLKLDNPAFTRTCMASLEKLAGKTALEINNHHGVTTFVLALRTEDPTARGRAEELIKGLPFDLKLRVLKSLNSDGEFGPLNPETLSFLCRFLDDAILFRDPDRAESESKNADERADEIEVRNYVSLRILGNLGIELPLGIKRTAKDWEEIREFAKSEVDRRLENKKTQ